VTALGGRSPREHVLLLTAGLRVAGVLYAVAELGIADLLAAGPRDAETLGREANCDPGALRRLLRAAASVGVFREVAAGGFELTPAAELLRTGAPDSQRDLVLYSGRMIFPLYGGISDAVRTGKPVFADVFGMPFYDYLNTYPSANDIVYRAAGLGDRDVVEQCAAAVDLTRFAVVVDIGGGTGTFLAHLLSHAPRARGVLYDRPEALPVSDEPLARLGVAERVNVVGGNFFTDPLPAADLYVVKNTLRSLADEEAIRLLGRVRAAMADNPDARLLICDRIVAPGSAWDHAKFLDLDMLLLHGGRERTAAEWRDLTAAAGLRLEGGGDVLLCAPRCQ
jgi:O-methyltransferase domain/Dimerisation domain